MKDSSFIQPVTQVGTTTSISKPQRSNKQDTGDDPMRHKEAASEFNKKFDKTQANKSVEASTEDNAAISNKTGTKIDIEMASVENNRWQFPEGTNPFESADEETGIKDVESDTIEEAAILSTIKTEVLSDKDTRTLNIEDLIYIVPEGVEDTPLPEEIDTQILFQTTKSENPDTTLVAPEETSTVPAEEDIYIAQTQAAQVSASPLSKDGLEQVPVENNRPSLRSDVSIEARFNDIETGEIDIEAQDLDIEGTIDLSDVDVEVPKNSNQSFQQNIFPNSNQNSALIGQPFVSIGGELASPTVFSGTTSVTNAAQVAANIPPAIQNTVISTVSDAILTAKETPKGVMVQLDPPEMGRVYIDFMFDADNRVNVVVKADNIDSFNLLRERSQDFLQMLGDNGFSNIDLSFEQQGSDEGTSDSSNDNAEPYGVAYAEAAQDSVETSYRTPLYKVNEDQLRLDLRL